MFSLGCLLDSVGFSPPRGFAVGTPPPERSLARVRVGLRRASGGWRRTLPAPPRSPSTLAGFLEDALAA
ncbi:hypothetical protein M885DRAFT_534331 [Pelagophyceae sp. CCMP2097]|nr:hypothetical protein M885DRAFT_534331 [Pelagophyceae sp. CCMP2097]